MMIAPSSSTAGELARRPTPGAGHGGVSIIRVRMFDGSGARWGCDQRLNGLANAGELWSNCRTIMSSCGLQAKTSCSVLACGTAASHM